jgi:hypothetical protein
VREPVGESLDRAEVRGIAIDTLLRDRDGSFLLAHRKGAVVTLVREPGRALERDEQLARPRIVLGIDRREQLGIMTPASAARVAASKSRLEARVR